MEVPQGHDGDRVSIRLDPCTDPEGGTGQKVAGCGLMPCSAKKRGGGMLRFREERKNYVELHVCAECAGCSGHVWNRWADG
jgi:hypothetical protein